MRMMTKRKKHDFIFLPINKIMFESDCLKKVKYNPIVFHNNRVVFHPITNRKAKLKSKYITTNNVLNLAILFPKWNIRRIVCSTSEKAIKYYKTMTFYQVGFHKSPSDDIQYFSYDESPDKSENMAIELTLDKKMNEYLEKKYKNSIFFVYSIEKPDFAFKQSFYNTQTLPMRLNENKEHILPLQEKLTDMVRKEFIIYYEGLKLSGDISIYNINMKIVLALACMLEYCSPIDILPRFFDFQYDFDTYHKKYVGQTDIHTFVNIFLDLCVYQYENWAYNKLVSQDPMDYLIDWMNKNKINSELFVQVMKNYFNCVKIFEQRTPFFIRFDNISDFPQNVNPTYFSVKKELSLYDNKDYVNFGSYGASKFCDTFKEFTKVAKQSVIFQSLENENVQKYLKYREEKKQGYGNIYFYENSYICSHYYSE